jgi:choline dehydrogenase-like flavoprotein
MVYVRQDFPRNPDYNNGHQEGFGYFQATQKNGRRWSTARAFLDPARRRPNLRIETEALATGVLLDGKRAVGVAYVQRGEAREARCSGEVILCAGAVKSPHLLELSGIGNPEILQSAGITVRHELRGVGENFRDHYAPRMNWRVTLPITLNEQTRGARPFGKCLPSERKLMTGAPWGWAGGKPQRNCTISTPSSRRRKTGAGSVGQMSSRGSRFVAAVGNTTGARI